MSAPKLITTFGVLAKYESTYNAGGTAAAAADGIQVCANPIVAVNYAHDGKRPHPPGTSSAGLTRVAPSGRYASGQFKIQSKGAGAPYSSSVVPRDVDVLLRACGFGRTIVTTGGSESVTYAPVSGAQTGNAFQSAFLNVYGKAELYVINGLYADLTIDLLGPQPVEFTFDWDGTMTTDVADATLPAITYAPTLLPPKSTNVAFTLGAFTSGLIRKAQLKLNRKRTPRVNINASGHAGWSLGDRDPMLTVTVESMALPSTPYNASTAIDPYKLRDLATSLALSMTIGSVQYNRFTISSGNAQIVDVKEVEDGASACWELSIDLSASNASAEDDISIAYN